MAVTDPVTASTSLSSSRGIRLSAGSPDTLVADGTQADTDQVVLLDGTSATVEYALLPAASWTGQFVTVKAIDITSACTVLPDGAELLEGLNSARTLTPQYKSETYWSDGTDVHVICSHTP